MSDATPVIQTVSFDPEGVEITYAERHNIFDNGLRIFSTAMVPRALIEEHLADLEEAALALLDQISVVKRSPETSFKRGL